MNQPHVLVLTDDSDFPQALLSRWQQERIVPAFTVLGSDALHGPTAPECDLAIVGPVRSGRLTPVLKTLDAAARPTICMVEPGAADALRKNFARVLVTRQTEEWDDLLVLIAIESLRRIEATHRARRAEQAAAKLQHNAALGQYMLEVRHSLNNALTSVLGNAELLLLEPDRFNKQVREQIETIHSMSLRIHETLYRFSSLENEMQFAEKQSQAETASWPNAAAAGA